jgi:hypothetical protein
LVAMTGDGGYCGMRRRFQPPDRGAVFTGRCPFCQNFVVGSDFKKEFGNIF